jgi:transcriptional regulator with XRE-family HTH domain
MAKKFSLRAFAGKLEMAPAYLCDIEMSRRNPPGSTKLAAICELLGANLDEMSELARRDRKKIELDVDTKTEPIRNMAFALARTFEDMDEDTADKITELLNRAKGL